MSERKQWGQYVSSTQEDECLVEVIEDLGIEDWSIVAEILAEKYSIRHRSGKKCRERWINHLKPEVSKSIWTPDEEQTLLRSQAYYGNR